MLVSSETVVTLFYVVVVVAVVVVVVAVVAVIVVAVVVNVCFQFLENFLKLTKKTSGNHMSEFLQRRQL